MPGDGKPAPSYLAPRLSSAAYLPHMPPTGKYGGDLRQAHLPDEQVILGHRAQRVRSIKTE
jgi:hypothetical protein